MHPYPAQPSDMGSLCSLSLTPRITVVPFCATRNQTTVKNSETIKFTIIIYLKGNHRQVVYNLDNIHQRPSDRCRSSHHLLPTSTWQHLSNYQMRQSISKRERDRERERCRQKQSERMGRERERGGERETFNTIIKSHCGTIIFKMSLFFFSNQTK